MTCYTKNKEKVYFKPIMTTQRTIQFKKNIEEKPNRAKQPEKTMIIKKNT